MNKICKIWKIALCFVIVVCLCLSVLLLNHDIRTVNAESAIISESENCYEESKGAEPLKGLASCKINVQNNDVVAEIEQTLSDSDSSVILELTKQKENYESMLENTTDLNEQENLQSLILATNKLIDQCNNLRIAPLSNEDKGEDYSAVISAAVAYFNISSYKLAAELLTHMSDNTVKNSKYTPIHGMRVMSSDLTYDLALGSEVNGSGVYSQDGTVNGNDLHYSINSFDFKKTSANSKVLIIEDTYDFAKDEYSGIENAVINELYKAQEAGQLVPFKTSITFDATSYLRIQNLGGSLSSWKIKVTNYSSATERVIYNKKMSFGGDAQNWKGLTDIAYRNIPGNGGSIELNISGNAAATHIAFSRVSGNNRFITYANELSEDGGITQYTAKVRYNIYGALKLIGKSGSEWIIEVTNPYAERMQLEYNKLMCFGDDGKNWIGLKDLKRTYLSAGASTIIRIGENAAATHIAISFKKDAKRYIICANELNANCTMNVGNTIDSRAYLRISNLGKSGGKWKIQIMNMAEMEVEVSYNKKMCFLNDAKKWSGLKDIGYKKISPLGTAVVEISTNWFATCVAMSFVHNGERIITYANGLLSDGSIHVMHSLR